MLAQTPHQARPDVLKEKITYSDATTRLLDDGSKNESMIDVGLGGNLLDRIIDGANLWPAIICPPTIPPARREHDLLVVVEHVLEADPVVLCWPSSTGATVSPIHGVFVLSIADTILIVDAGDFGTSSHNATLGACNEVSSGASWSECVVEGHEVAMLVTEEGGMVWNGWLDSRLWWVRHCCGEGS